MNWKGEYLIPKRQTKKRAHLWTGTDTVCRMYSTGGLGKRHYVVSETQAGHDVCQNCMNIHLGIPNPYYRPADNPGRDPELARAVETARKLWKE